MSPVRLALLASSRAVDALAPLLRCWATEGHVVGLLEDVDLRATAPADVAADADAVLVVGPPRRSPRTVLPGPVVTADAGRVVPVAWLPDTGWAAVRQFAETAAQVHGRSGRARTLAVLGQRHPRYDDLADRVTRLAQAHDEAPAPAQAQAPGGEDGERYAMHVRRLTAYDVVRSDLVAELAQGFAAAVYLGHGRPAGWAGYGGVRAPDLGPAARTPWRPLGLVLSLTCHTASRHRTGLSYAEALPLRGVAAAALGAVSRTRHPSNARWALRVCRDLGRCATVGDLVAGVAPADPGAATYRLLGDPTAPLLDDPAVDRSTATALAVPA